MPCLYRFQCIHRLCLHGGSVIARSTPRVVVHSDCSKAQGICGHSRSHQRGRIYRACLGRCLCAHQFIPYGKSHSNPLITGEPKWADDTTRDLMVRACFGCHSNEVEYPSYANVAPISWAVESHTEEARDAVNYSEFGSSDGEFDGTIESIQEGSMPPSYFTRFGLHQDSILTAAETKQLIAGLLLTPGMGENENEK